MTALRIVGVLFLLCLAVVVGRVLKEYRHANAPARAIGFAAVEALPTYRVVVGAPVWVCYVPGFVFEETTLATYYGTCLPDAIFSNGFES